MELRFEDSALDTVVEVGVERMDRTDFTFWNQTAGTAAPKQSWYKWLFSFLPDEWTELPFTWARLACNVVGGAAERLPLPLRNHVLTLKVARAEERYASIENDRAPAAEAEKRLLRHRIDRWKKQMPNTCQVTAALTHAQSRQLIAAHYISRFHGTDAAISLWTSAFSVCAMGVSVCKSEDGSVLRKPI